MGCFAKINQWLDPVCFFDISFGAFQSTVLAEDGSPVLGDDGSPQVTGPKVPLIVVFLLLGGIFFTFRFGFINFRLFGHSIAVIRGKYDNPNDHGEVSHFQALTAALSATVGLGNIAGVAIAISGGGPGAVFWMWVVAVFGMSSKFSSCTLAQLYRKIEPEDGKREHVLGGPMLYLSEGMKDMLGKSFGTPLGKVLAIMFAFFAIGGALGGGNMFQANQTAEIVSFVALDGDKSYGWLVGVIMAVLVALVIVGGIRRIGDVTSKIVPAMCVFYCLVCLVIILANAGKVPDLMGSIFDAAFNVKAAGWGGVMGILVTGVTRGAFSNEAGLGSAAIAHSAARTDEPVREGVVGMIGPFIDTIVVCTMTALTILITQERIDESALAGSEGWVRGAAMTAEASARYTVLAVPAVYRGVRICLFHHDFVGLLRGKSGRVSVRQDRHLALSDRLPRFHRHRACRQPGECDRLHRLPDLVDGISQHSWHVDPLSQDRFGGQRLRPPVEIR